MMLRRAPLLLLPALLSLGAAAVMAQDAAMPQASEAPQRIFVHGNILTGTRLRADDHDPMPGRVQAMAVRNGIVTAIGSDALILSMKGDRTEVVDLHGTFAMPGFNDAHTHLADGGQTRLSLDLAGTTSLGEMKARIAAYAATLPPGAWITGGGWDHTQWGAGQQLPSRADLDAASGGHPAFLMRVDGHIGVANSAALVAAKLSADTDDPAGGRLDRDSGGNLTGILREDPAIRLITAVIPPPTPEQRRAALLLAMNDALAHGVTSVQDFSTWDDWLVLESLGRQARLPLRVSEWLAFDTPLPVLESRRESHSSDDLLLHLGMLKGFMDGSLGSRTAAMDEPYSDDPANSGIPRYDPEKLGDMASQRASAGFQLGFHAIGDRANDMALDAFEAAEQVAKPVHQPWTPPLPGDPDSRIVTAGTASLPSDPEANFREVRHSDLRYRIEHAQVVSPDAFDRFRQLGVIASMQPSHLLTDMAWAGARLGPERSRYAYAWRSFLNHGVVLAFGTDYPVESISPFRGLYAAVTRRNEAGTQSFQPQEAITIQQAIYAYTQGSAFAEFRETRKGRLEPGMLADMVVLDHDITSADPQTVLHTHVLQTVVGGVTMYRSDAATPPAQAATPASSRPVEVREPKPTAHVPPPQPADTPPTMQPQPDQPSPTEKPITGVSHPPGEPQR